MMALAMKVREGDRIKFDGIEYIALWDAGDNGQFPAIKVYSNDIRLLHQDDVE